MIKIENEEEEEEILTVYIVDIFQLHLIYLSSIGITQ